MDIVTLVAGVDPVEQRREEVKAKFGLRDEQLFPSLEEALKAVEVDFGPRCHDAVGAGENRGDFAESRLACPRGESDG
jgi:hypothetical protein